MMASPGGALIAVVITVVALLAGCGSTPPAAGPAAVAGYVVPWDARSTATAGEGVLAEASPVWFQPTETGALAFASPDAEDAVPSIHAEASERGVDLVPTVSNFRDGRWDGDLVHRIITDPGVRAAHIAAIVAAVRSHGWAGIDLDYESLPAASRDAYSDFVRALAGALHEADARLTVPVHAKTSEPGSWHGAQAQDWRALGASADQVRVMAYDYSSSASAAGPVAPLAWVEQVLALAAALVPRDRIALGVPTYGYDWPTGAPGQPLQWADVQALAEGRGVPQQWDPGTASPWLRYTDEQGVAHSVWYENARSAAAKVDAARRHGVAGVVVWRLGGEDPALWDALRTLN